MTPRLAILACGKSKLATPAPARDLYTGNLFRAARDHVEARGLPWFVLSARYGLMEPMRVLPPYDRTLADARGDVDGFRRLTAMASGTLGTGVVHGRLGARLDFPAAVTIEVHAGAAYVAWLREIVARAPSTLHSGARVVWTIEDPCAGMEIGERLGFYRQARERQSGLFGSAA